jgi:putative spermidine/putrescine transport system permease protein
MMAARNLAPRQTIFVIMLLLPGIGPIVLLAGSVLAMAVAQSVGYFNFSGTSGFSLEFWANQTASPILASSVVYSLKIAFTSALLSTTLAYPVALWLRTSFPGSASVSALLRAPLLVPGLVATI